MNGHLLLIDDDPDLLENTSALLELHGYLVDKATNGLDGLKKARENPPRLIICDIMMPVMNGLELVEQIRQIPNLKTIPFIFLSAKVTSMDVRHGMNLGADDYLTKPFTTKDLVSSVSSRLARAQVVNEEIQSRVRQTKALMNNVSSHEYNTPLNGIIGANYLIINSDNQEEETVSLAKEVVKASWQLKRTLDNSSLTSLLLNDADTGIPAELTTGSCQLTTELVASIVKKTEQRYDSMRSVNLTITENTVPISLTALQKCLEEVIDNSFKFSETDQTVSLNSGFDETGFSITIHNEGRPFLPEDIACIDAYCQFDRKKYEQQGLGVGLFITQKLIHANEGQLFIESAADSGTSVKLWFPTGHKNSVRNNI